VAVKESAFLHNLEREIFHIAKAKALALMGFNPGFSSYRAAEAYSDL